MTSDAKLLPCPFCGGDADIFYDHTVEENHAYGCRACGFWFDTFNSDDPIVAWNRRTPHPAPATAREAEPTEDELDEAWKDGFNAGFGEAKLTAHPPQPSEAVAEALENMMSFARSKMDDPSRADDMRIFKDAEAALRALKGDGE